jgi:alanyl-tRNA synthetase
MGCNFHPAIDPFRDFSVQSSIVLPFMILCSTFSHHLKNLPMLKSPPMTTHRLYYDDSYLQSFEARVLSCVPSAPFSSGSEMIPAWEAILDQTAFYPASGGQPNDLGFLGEAKVLEVRDDGEDVLHIIDREQSTGSVQGCIQWERRFDHMQQHTGQHLLSAMFHERFGLHTVSFHLGSELCTIDLRGPEPNAEMLEGAQRAANSVIFEDRSVSVRYGTADQLSEIGVRKQVRREGLWRAIEIDSADLQPCGGTHVKSTGRIGMILVRRSTKIRQDWRVEFVCGSRAERLATSDFKALRGISDRLSCAPDEIFGAVAKSIAERDANFKSLRELSQQLAEARAQLIVSAAAATSDGTRLVAQVLNSAQAELLLPLANELAKHDSVIALLVAEDSGQLIFAQHRSAEKDMQALLKLVSATFPAKGGGTRDFVRAKLTDPKNSEAALALARTSVLP